jgi:hypothetical protein
MSGNTSIGHNILTNKFHSLNGQIPIDWLNKLLDTFKIVCKTNSWHSIEQIVMSKNALTNSLDSDYYVSLL